MAVDVSDEFARGLPDAAVAAASLAAVWLFGHRVSVHWNLRQKQRELDLAAVQQFYSTYGEFFAVWKLWSSFPQENGRVIDAQAVAHPPCACRRHGRRAGDAPW